MTKSPESATVRTLTAEVQTLVVGSRQITLSVARQLDIVPLESLEVMGRVRLRPERNRPDGWSDHLYVIGRHRASGRLAIATYSLYPDPMTGADRQAHLNASRSPLIVLAGLR